MATSVLSIKPETQQVVSTEMDGAHGHSAVLQTLDAYFPSPLSSTGMMFYGVDNFQGTVQAWEGKPVIFCGVYPPEHINNQDYLKDPVSTLEKIQGRVIGVIRWANVMTVGSKRLEAEPFIWDKYANELLEEGRLGLSTDFDCPYQDDKLIGLVTPNYLLTWEMEVANEQNDRGARFMNTAPTINEKENENMAPDPEFKAAMEKQEGLLSKILDALSNLGKPQANHANAAPEAVLEAATGVISPSVPVEYLDKMNALEQEKAAFAEKAAALEAKVGEFETAEAKRLEDAKAAEMAALETEWQTTIMPKLPKGLIHEEAKAAELKNLYISDVRGFLRTYGDVLNKAEVVLDGNMPNTAQGQTHANSAAGNASDACPVIGSYDALKGGFV